MNDCNSVNTPVATRMKLSREGDGGFVDSTLFKNLIGSLRYLMITRPETYGVRLISYYTETLESHWLAVKKILMYIKGSLNFGLFYAYGENTQLVGTQIVNGKVTKMIEKALHMSSILG